MTEPTMPAVICTVDVVLLTLQQGALQVARQRRFHGKFDKNPFISTKPL